jgi:prolycopene isomerase
VAAVVSKVLMEGVFYPKGGMGKMAETMANAFLNADGELHLQTEVDQILMKSGRVEGVVTKDGKIFESSLIISNINPNLLARMFAPERQPVLSRRIRDLQYSLSCFILYIATDLDLRGMGFPYFTYLRFLHDLEEEHRMLRRGEVPKNPTLIVSIPTLLDPSLAPPGQHLLKVLITVPYGYRETWGGGNAEKYHQIKEEFSQEIIDLLELKLFPYLRKHILFYEAATPLTLERYTGNERGAMYGLASIPQQMGPWRPPHRAPIPGLFQVGHYTRPSHGIVGASLSGLFAVRSILQQLHRV